MVVSIDGAPRYRPQITKTPYYRRPTKRVPMLGKFPHQPCILSDRLEMEAAACSFPLSFLRTARFKGSGFRFMVCWSFVKQQELSLWIFAPITLCF